MMSSYSPVCLVPANRFASVSGSPISQTRPSELPFNEGIIKNKSTLGGKAFSALRTTALYNSTSPGGGHAVQESVLSGSFQVAWLKSSFHM